MKYKKIYFLISAAVILPGVLSLFMWGLRPSVDFTGGTLWEVKFKKSSPESQSLETFLKKKEVNELISIQSTSDGDTFLRLKSIPEERKNAIAQLLSKKYGKLKELRFETVGPILGAELLQKTITGIVLASLVILGYVAYQFKDKMYGVCAILAMFHDTLVLLGLFSLFGHFFGVEIDTLFVTAILTTLSLSVHDTVVVYGRIRELSRLYPKTPFDELINRAINETLVRSLNNSLTIIFMLVALLLLGGATLKWFVAALLIGAVSGTFSSTFIATPLLVVWREIIEKKIPR